MFGIGNMMPLPGWKPEPSEAEKLRAERDLLRAALVGLVGVDGKIDLEQMEVVMRAMPAPAQDKAATIDAIHALIATIPEARPEDAVTIHSHPFGEPCTSKCRTENIPK
jgi:hypothetical protein